MNGQYILNADNIPVAEPDLLKWGKWMGLVDRGIIETTIGKRWISTVFLGLDHQYGDGPPLLYETMVFPIKGSEPHMVDEICKRYTTREKAIEGHEKIVNELRAIYESNLTTTE